MKDKERAKKFSFNNCIILMLRKTMEKAAISIDATSVIGGKNKNKPILRGTLSK